MGEDILNAIEEFFNNILRSLAKSLLEGTFDSINESVDDAKSLLGVTPQIWDGNMFRLIKSISETVILPIAGLIFSAIMIHNLINSIIDGNSFKDFEFEIIPKFIFKTCLGVLVLSNAFEITMAIFDVGYHLISSATGLIGDTNLSNFKDLDSALKDLGGGELLGLIINCIIMKITLFIITLLLNIIVVGRMIEIFLYVSVAPIPFATFGNREWGTVGQNYVKNLAALALQGLLMIIILRIYTSMIATLALDFTDIGDAMIRCLITSGTMCFMLMKCGAISKSICNAI